MESPDETRLIKGWKGGKRERKGYGKVELPDELQYELIKKSGKGTSLGWSR
jgi:hypothetical protein